MVNKKYIVIAGVGLSIALALLYLPQDSEGPLSDPSGGINATPEARAIMLACDSLAARPWKAVQQRRVEMRVEMAASQGLLTAEEHLRLTTYLRSSVSRSMQLAFTAWAGSGCGTPLDELEQAMRKAANWEGCKAIVEPSLRLAGMYREALALPGKSVAATKGPYESAKDAGLRGTIQRLAAAREIAGCSVYSNALVRARRTLDEFAAFDKEFREAENVYKKKASDFSYRMLMVEFCPDNDQRIQQYPHYLEQVRLYGLCD
jgi:hypothetical protein